MWWRLFQIGKYTQRWKAFIVRQLISTIRDIRRKINHQDYDVIQPAITKVEYSNYSYFNQSNIANAKDLPYFDRCSFENPPEFVSVINRKDRSELTFTVWWASPPSQILCSLQSRPDFKRCYLSTCISFTSAILSGTRVQVNLWTLWQYVQGVEALGSEEGYKVLHWTTGHRSGTWLPYATGSSGLTFRQTCFTTRSWKPFNPYNGIH